MEEKSVPVMVDDRKDVGDFQMTRVAYYYVEATEPLPDMPINPGDLGISTLPLEFSGAIYKPNDTSEFFESPGQIEDLFQAVEQYESLYVDSDNLWIPNHLFDKTPERGDIFRVSFSLFTRLYMLARNNAVLDIEESLPGHEDNVSYSENETRAFAQWADGILKNVIATYPKNAELKLAWRAGHGEA